MSVDFRLRYLGLLGLMLFFSEARLPAEQFVGDPELFRVSAENIQEDVDRIHRWKGTLEVKEALVDSDGKSRKFASEVSFAWDQQKEWLRWKWNRSRYSIEDADEGGTIGVSWSVSGLVKEGVFYRAMSVPSSKKTPADTVVIFADNPFSFGPESTDFDPTYCFSDQGESLMQRFQRLYQRARANHADLWSVSAEGRFLVARGETRLSNGLVTNVYTFDLTQGGCRTSYQGHDPAVKIDFTYKYEQVDGCWVPVHHRYERSEATGPSGYVRESQWTQNRVNWDEANVAKEFSLTSVGIDDGDRIKDNRDGTQYTVGCEKAASASLNE